MKILYHHRTLADGAEGIHIAEMVNAFRQLGHEVLLVGPGVKKEGATEARSEKFAWVKRFFRGPFYEIVELAYNVVCYKYLLRKIQEFKPHFIYDRYITFNYAVVAAGKKRHLPVFLEVNAPLAYERDHEADETLYLKKLAYGIEKKVCCEASKTIVVSTPLKEYLASVGVPEKQVLVLPNGVNVKKFFPRERSLALKRKLSVHDGSVVIGFVGILRPWHGIELLLDVFKTLCNEFVDCRLLLVGDGPIQEEIENKVERLGLTEKVIITGRVAHDEVADYIALFDIAVSPKVTFYASPMKIIEYMAQQKAVVAPDMANIRDLIRDREDGLLFQSEKVGSMFQAIRELILDESLRNELGRRALSSVEKRLNWINNARFVLEEYQKIKLSHFN